MTLKKRGSGVPSTPRLAPTSSVRAVSPLNLHASAVGGSRPELSLDSVPDILENNTLEANEQDDTEIIQESPLTYRYLSDQKFGNSFSPPEFNNPFSPHYNDIKNNPGPIFETLSQEDSQGNMPESEPTNFNNPDAAGIGNPDVPRGLPSQKKR